MGECELHRACVRCVVAENSGRKGETTASWDGRVLPLASDRATEERYMGTCLVSVYCVLCIVEVRCRGIMHSKCAEKRLVLVVVKSRTLGLAKELKRNDRNPMVVVVLREFYSPSHDSFCCVQLSIISGLAGVVVIFLCWKRLWRVGVRLIGLVLNSAPCGMGRLDWLIPLETWDFGWGPRYSDFVQTVKQP